MLTAIDSISANKKGHFVSVPAKVSCSAAEVTRSNAVNAIENRRDYY